MNAAQHKAKATELLVNYFEAIAKRAGMKWDGDYTAEIGEAVDQVVDAAIESVVALDVKVSCNLAIADLAVIKALDERLAAVERLAANTLARVEGFDNLPDYVTRAHDNNQRRRATDTPATIEPEQDRRR